MGPSSPRKEGRGKEAVGPWQGLSLVTRWLVAALADSPAPARVWSARSPFRTFRVPSRSRFAKNMGRPSLCRPGPTPLRFRLSFAAGRDRLESPSMVPQCRAQSHGQGLVCRGQAPSSVLPRFPVVGREVPLRFLPAPLRVQGVEGKAGRGFDVEGQGAGLVGVEEGAGVADLGAGSAQPVPGDRRVDARHQFGPAPPGQPVQVSQDAPSLQGQDLHRVVRVGAAQPAALAGADRPLHVQDVALQGAPLTGAPRGPPVAHPGTP